MKERRVRGERRVNRERERERERDLNLAYLSHMLYLIIKQLASNCY